MKRRPHEAVVVLAGRSRVFCSGADLTATENIFKSDAKYPAIDPAVSCPPPPICLKPRHPRPIFSKPRHPRSIRPKPRHPRPIRRCLCRAAAHDSARDLGRSVDTRAPSSTLMARTRGVPSDAASLHLEGRSPVDATSLLWPFTAAERRRHGPPSSRSQIRGSTVRSQPQWSSVINKAASCSTAILRERAVLSSQTDSARQVPDVPGVRPPTARRRT
ncbi:uncharacterized protein LOC109712441 [Ananas comosus]|uniref:Uncharacterized protein LOC109712441 n=1 Tax=Ananas comosus TaxID=4615 RepID=A0A6P5F7K4_ANACO|nr:uncharacterized protein LOC109712441 [Ananas comosus]